MCISPPDNESRIRQWPSPPPPPNRTPPPLPPFDPRFSVNENLPPVERVRLAPKSPIALSSAHDRDRDTQLRSRSSIEAMSSRPPPRHPRASSPSTSIASIVDSRARKPSYSDRASDYDDRTGRHREEAYRTEDARTREDDRRYEDHRRRESERRERSEGRRSRSRTPHTRRESYRGTSPPRQPRGEPSGSEKERIWEARIK